MKKIAEKNSSTSCWSANTSKAQNKAQHASKNVEISSVSHSYIAKGKEAQGASEQYLLLSSFSPKIVLENIVPIDEKTAEHCNFAILLFFADVCYPIESTSKKNFFIKVIGRFRKRKVQERPCYFERYITQMSKLEILALETGLIKRYIIDKVEKNDVTFSAVARSFILLRDTQNMLNSMPDGYKSYLLKELPAEEKTQHNLERCFKDSIKKSYISFMDLLEKSQKHYRLEDSKSTAEEIKSVEPAS